ncbi:glycoside hydrolase domain-containing protein [Aestuariivivens insulae]|uniref:glycoside hydrolase domain-containing protein n=1 Tax=Aestuariivivens insulae TaxID=1621988 RepID=UPI001F579B01|nr:glycoside hydrolase domain-containing protein [Aestuariivivens insulae]
MVGKGDEDEGQMGAWFIMSSMGLFEMNGGGEAEPLVDISSPLFEKITIHLDNDFYEGKIFVIEAKNNSNENIYINRQN